MLDQLVSSSVLTINRSADFDHFRSIERLADSRSIPLQWRNFASGFAAVTLRFCSVYLQRTFPRIIQNRYCETGAIVAFGMDDEFSAIIDGADMSRQSLMLIKGGADCDVVEPKANLIGFVKFDGDDRGWPGEAGRARLIPTRPAELAALRSAMRDIMLLASHSADLLQQPRVVEQVEESLLQAIDQAMQTPSSPDDAGRAECGQYLRLVRKLDEFLQANSTRVSRTADLANELGVSVRTLNNAVVAVRGLSMHRYTRLRRLWNVRKQLMQGPPTETTKAVALANGFWHMGEFRSLYRDLFGETPQRTLDTVRRQ